MCSLKNPRYIIWAFDSLPATAVCQTLERPTYFFSQLECPLHCLLTERRDISFSPKFKASFWILISYHRTHISLLRINDTGKYPLPQGNPISTITGAVSLHYLGSPFTAIIEPTSGLRKGCISRAKLAILQCREDRTDHPCNYSLVFSEKTSCFHFKDKGGPFSEPQDWEFPSTS